MHVCPAKQEGVTRCGLDISIGEGGHAGGLDPTCGRPGIQAAICYCCAPCQWAELIRISFLWHYNSLTLHLFGFTFKKTLGNPVVGEECSLVVIKLLCLLYTCGYEPLAKIITLSTATNLLITWAHLGMVMQQSWLALFWADLILQVVVRMSIWLAVYSTDCAFLACKFSYAVTSVKLFNLSLWAELMKDFLPYVDLCRYVLRNLSNTLACCSYSF